MDGPDRRRRGAPNDGHGSFAGRPRWSPDGKYLTFMTSSSSGQGSQVFTLALSGGERVQLTRVEQGV
ncbi:MAG: PD40 domain-containing protein, partial [Gemmatimonadetes bacterium]|nr:PD40 domain-containing protein [Gemmatimonadota bacterium]